MYISKKLFDNVLVLGHERLHIQQVSSTSAFLINGLNDAVRTFDSGHRHICVALDKNRDFQNSIDS